MDKKELKIQEFDIELLNKSSIADYSDGDIAIIDSTNSMADLKPVYAKMNFVILCTRGRIQFNLNNRTINLYKNEILLSLSYVILDNYLISDDFECKILCLSDRAIQSLLHGKIDRWNFSVYIRNNNIVRLSEDGMRQYGYYHHLIKYKMDHRDQPHSRVIIHSLIRAMLLELCGMLEEDVNYSHEEHPSHGRVLFSQFLSLLQRKEIRRQPVGRYAYELAITPKYLTVICQKYSGRTAFDWIEQYTIEDIRYHLLHTDLSIKEISVKLGFANISFFGSYVRKHFNMSPTEIRKGMVNKEIKEQKTQGDRE